MAGDDEAPAGLDYYLEHMRHKGLGRVAMLLSRIALQDVSEMQI